MNKDRFMKDFNGEKIFSLEYDKETLKDMVLEKQEEIERLNKSLEELQQKENIINELEQWLKDRLEKLDINGYDDDVFNGIELALQKLKELKGSGKVD